MFIQEEKSEVENRLTLTSQYSKELQAEKINEAALCCLDSQDWTNAQNLFFKNAKQNPSHKTLNNLGVFLISEGMVLKNGKCRNATKLGMKYLLKAKAIETSTVNLLAIITAVEFELINAENKDREALLKYLCKLLEDALEVQCSNELMYNYLRCKYLMCSVDEKVLQKIRVLIKNYVSKETIALYFAILQNLHLKEEGLLCIQHYSDYIDEIDLLMFYTRFGFYKEGFELCETISKTYAPDKIVSAAIMECCINTGRFEEAKMFSQRIKDAEEDMQYSSKEQWCDQVFCNMLNSSDFRKRIIEDYYSIPPTLEICCYFGCKVHRVDW